MKFAAVFVATLSVAAAFAPQQAATRQSTEFSALFDDIANMDLFSPVKDQNDYGARNKKKLGGGKLTDKSYVPAGLSKAEYEKVRAADEAKKAKSYQKNVAKAGKFLGFDEFYLKRGTEEGGSWLKAPAKGHRMAKTKYDYDNVSSNAKKPEAFSGSIFGRKK
jgi:hypothetical protein